MTVRNPWAHLPSDPPYVLESDRHLVERHNARRAEKYQFQTGLLPEPFVGRLNAPVVFLNLNPGYAKQDATDYSTPRRHDMLSRNLTHELPDSEAFYYLTDEFRDTGGWRWWHKKLAPLIREVGIEAVMAGVQVVEFVPYKSKNFYGLSEVMPSQLYSIDLVRRAAERQTPIVVMRSYRRWVEQVPDLATANIHLLNSPQNVTISRRNCPTGFDKIADLIAD